MTAPTQSHFEFSAVDRYADRVQPGRDRRARAPRLGLHGQAPALPVSRTSADRRIRQDGDVQGEGRGAARSGRLHAEAARLSRLCRGRAAAQHHDHGRPRRRARRLRCVLGRGAVERAQGARLPRRRHQRLGPRYPDDRTGLPDAGRLDRAVARLCPRRRFRHRRDGARHGGAAAAISSMPTATAPSSFPSTRSMP